jgi:hypothetical protein
MTARDLAVVRWLFRGAAVYGALALLPMYLMPPPGLTHPVYYYGFVGVALAWQLAFWIVASDPVRYRMLILPGIVEKLGFGVAASYLHLTTALPLTLALGGALDLAMAALFAWVFVRLGTPADPNAP